MDLFLDKCESTNYISFITVSRTLGVRVMKIRSRIVQFQ